MKNNRIEIINGIIKTNTNIGRVDFNDIPTSEGEDK